jgi:phenylalanyl-tRNA synthetase beta chain
VWPICERSSTTIFASCSNFIDPDPLAMKFAETWLREWVDPKLDTEALGHKLTMAGHEVKSIESQGSVPSGVVIAEVLTVSKHPNADRLSVCQVSTGKGKPVEVVCGAPNVVAGMKSPLASPGVRLSDGTNLRRSKIRGVESNGMLCSAIELGLGDEADGIIALPDDAPTGTDLSAYLGLPDEIFDVDLTPNRGDCFSVLGIARDVAAITGARLTLPSLPKVAVTIDDVHPVTVKDPSACPRFAGRVIRNIDASARSPIWMTERLRRSGLRAIHPVVDVTNYVMLELGQPLHAYDLGLLKGAIRPRFAKKGEKVTLLDEKEVDLVQNTLLITDDSGPIGIAGIMGGLSTAVSNHTRDVFFEAAFWPPSVIAGRARSYGLHTDASLRFERGVDPNGQARAVERATELLVAISGGEVGPLTDLVDHGHLPAAASILLRRTRLERVLGTRISDDKVVEMLKNLQLGVEQTTDGWQVLSPAFRFDLKIEDDLVEEVARIYGYDLIPETTATAELPLRPVSESKVDLDLVAASLVARDYQEVITYSFIDANINRRFTGDDSELILSNPISSEMSVMRGSLWPGMITSAAANVARQQERVRFFEIGKSFHGTLKKPLEVVRVSGLAIGSAVPEQWSGTAQSVDFFDIKSDLEALLHMAGDDYGIEFEASSHVVLQPGQVASIVRHDQVIGVLGKLHPAVARSFDINKDVILFELDAALAFTSYVPKSSVVSKFPAIRRDISVVVDENISAGDLVKVAVSSAPDLIRNVTIFDVYQGPGIEAGRKSIALGLILQETSRTLTDEDADSVMDAAVRNLKREFAADLRD